MPTRQWQRDLQDPTSPLSLRVARESFDLDQYVAAALDGLTGDLDLSTVTFQPAAFGECGRDGFTDAQRAVYVQLKRALVERFGSIDRTSDLRLGMLLVIEWNRRATAPFHATDGAYFASDADRRAHQRVIDERVARQAARTAVVDAREAKGRELAERGAVNRQGDTFLVASESGGGVYRVTLVGGELHCECPDFERRGLPCKHIWASAIVAAA